jgi:hypothetical protein
MKRHTAINPSSSIVILNAAPQGRNTTLSITEWQRTSLPHHHSHFMKHAATLPISMLLLVLTIAGARASSLYYNVATGYAVTDLITDFTVSGGFTVYNGNVYTWTHDSYSPLSPGYRITNLATGNITLVSPGGNPNGGGLDGNGFGDPFGFYDPYDNIFYAGTFNGFGTGMWYYNQADDKWKKLGVFNSLYAATAVNGRVYASGLNAIWAGGTSQDNVIALYDLTGGSAHDILIQATGPSAACAVDKFGNVYYANYAAAGVTGKASLYMWTAEQIDSVRADLGHGAAGGGEFDSYLTYADGRVLTVLPDFSWGANGITVDDGGNVFVSYNGGETGILMWNESLGDWKVDDAYHYEIIATATKDVMWAGFLDAEGDLLNGGTLYANAYNSPGLAAITFDVVPEPGTWALMAAGLLLLLLRSLHQHRSPHRHSERSAESAQSKNRVDKTNVFSFYHAVLRLRGCAAPLRMTVGGNKITGGEDKITRGKVVPTARISLTTTLLLLCGLAATVSAQPIETPNPPNPATGPYGGGVGGYPANWFNEPVPGFVGPDGVGKARLPAGLDDDWNPVYQNPNNYVNPSFVGWATGVVEYKPANGVAQQWQTPSKVLGPVTGDNFDIVTLGELYLPYDVTISGVTMSAPVQGQIPPYVNAGDPNRVAYSGDPADQTDGFSFVGYDQPGSITLSFASPIVNGTGADLVVFENAFVSNYDIPGTGTIEGGVFAELAYVEVSTDGIHFARFPSISLTAEPSNRYGSLDPSNVYNLAGASCNAYGESWGTAFDLEDLLYDPAALAFIEDGYLNLDNIIYIKIIDIPGCGYYTDSLGNPIYDAWYTYGSGGFDLEAIGVLHNRESEYGELTGISTLTMRTQAIPEPSAWLLLTIGLGMGALGFHGSKIPKLGNNHPHKNH